MIMRLFLVSFLLWPLAVSSVSAEGEQTFAHHYRAAIAAYQSGDAAAFVSAARSARELRPDSPQAAYLLAAAYAMAGQPEHSLLLLQDLAAQNLQFQPVQEPAFANLELEKCCALLLQQFEENGEPYGSADLSFSFDDGRFVPEGIAWDEKRQRFLLGSVHQRRVVSVSADGQLSEFLPLGQGGLLSVFGMQIDAASDSLWLATSGLRESGDIDAAWLGRAGIMRFNLETGEAQAAHWLPDDEREHVLGDLQLLPDGKVLTTDSVSGEVLRLDPASGAFEVLLPSGTMVSPQGLVLDETGQSAWVADYRGGIFRLSLADGVLKKVAEGGTSHHGIDGLYRSGDWLVAIQNGLRPNRVVALQLDSAGLAVEHFEVLAAALPEFDEPTLGVVVADRFHFIANSHWPKFDRDGMLPDGLSGPTVLSVQLPGSE